MKAARAAILSKSTSISVDWPLGFGRLPVGRLACFERTSINQVITEPAIEAIKWLPKFRCVFIPYNFGMSSAEWTIRGLRAELAKGTLRPSELADRALACANRTPGRNTYLWQDAEWTRAESARIEAVSRAKGGPFGDGRHEMWGLPISVKDCFDLAGAPTSCGVQFYRGLHGEAGRDSWLVAQLRLAGAIITGKTNLHPLAYGITGENLEFGDCLQPGKIGQLTGGSSSGAAASVLEGSAVAAIGTDTGGSIRVPAALCGLAGYRASVGRGNWRGGAHLAESFDTMGWLFRDLSDAPFLSGIFAPRPAGLPGSFTRFAFLGDGFLHDCEPEIVASFHAAIRELEFLGFHPIKIEPDWWEGSFAIFAAIQAWEAARIHSGHFDHFEPAIRERLYWGQSITPAEIAALRIQHAEFRNRMDELFVSNELVLLPAAPVTGLTAGADHTRTRGRLLRYTTPFSLAGVPVVTLPCAAGGMQLAASRECDEQLLQCAAQLGDRREPQVPAQRT